MIHKPNCENFDKTTIRTSSESHLYWKNHFHKNPIFFRIYADFEADNEFDYSNIDNKTTNIYKQNPVLNGHHKEHELIDILQSYDNVDWFVNEVIKKEKKCLSVLKTLRKIS